MPRYDYACEKCRNVFEVQLSFADSDTARPTCPNCDSTNVKRRIGRVLVKRGRSPNALTSDQMMTAVALAEADSPAPTHDHHEDSDH